MTKPSGFYQLRLFTDNSALKKRYQDAITHHNTSYGSDVHPDSGFDLYVPNECTLSEDSISYKINHEIMCSMVFQTYENKIPSAYYLYPRSSTGSKTPLRLANSVGIIDSGYRGNIISVFDNIGKKPFKVDALSRIVQICTPTLEPFLVSLVESKDELGVTVRDTYGFGSSGK